MFELYTSSEKPYLQNQVVDAMPYMGNKRKLATKIINTIYDTVGNFDILYDLFGGGASNSVAGLMSSHIVVYNEINTSIVNLLKYIQEGGELPNKWITREEFNNYKNGNDWYAGFVKCCWSFGNNQRDYLFGKNVEELKREAHEYLLANGYDGTSTIRIKLINEFKNNKGIINRFELQQLEQIEQLKRLEEVQKLRSLEKLLIENKSYDEVEIIGNKSVIYCDPPYKNTQRYQHEIDHEKFYKWCLENTRPVFISGYSMPEEFLTIASFEHRSILSATANNRVFENVFWNNVNF